MKKFRDCKTYTTSTSGNKGIESAKAIGNERHRGLFMEYISGARVRRGRAHFSFRREEAASSIRPLRLSAIGYL